MLSNVAWKIDRWAGKRSCHAWHIARTLKNVWRSKRTVLQRERPVNRATMIARAQQKSRSIEGRQAHLGSSDNKAMNTSPLDPRLAARIVDAFDRSTGRQCPIPRAAQSAGRGIGGSAVWPVMLLPPPSAERQVNGARGPRACVARGRGVRRPWSLTAIGSLKASSIVGAFVGTLTEPCDVQWRALP